MSQLEPNLSTIIASVDSITVWGLGCELLSLVKATSTIRLSSKALGTLSKKYFIASGGKCLEPGRLATRNHQLAQFVISFVCFLGINNKKCCNCWFGNKKVPRSCNNKRVFRMIFGPKTSKIAPWSQPRGCDQLLNIGPTSAKKEGPLRNPFLGGYMLGIKVALCRNHNRMFSARWPFNTPFRKTVAT